MPSIDPAQEVAGAFLSASRQIEARPEKWWGSATDCDKDFAAIFDALMPAVGLEFGVPCPGELTRVLVKPRLDRRVVSVQRHVLAADGRWGLYVTIGLDSIIDEIRADVLSGMRALRNRRVIAEEAVDDAQIVTFVDRHEGAPMPAAGEPPEIRAFVSVRNVLIRLNYVGDRQDVLTLWTRYCKQRVIPAAVHWAEELKSLARYL